MGASLLALAKSIYYDPYRIPRVLSFHVVTSAIPSLFFQALVSDQLQETQGMCEYALYVQGTIREQSFMKWGRGGGGRGSEN